MSNTAANLAARHSKAAIAWDALNLRSRTALLKRILSNPAGAAVVKDGAVVLDEVAPFQYGYGDCYMESALSLMVDRDLIDIARRLMRSPASTKNKTVVIQSVTDVKLRRDLHLGGKA